VVFYLHIGTDPTTWLVPQESAIDAVAQELAQATGPVVLPVKFPLAGTLVLSVRSAGAVWVASPPPMGIHPSGAKLPAPLIYVSSAVAATPETPGGYPLPPATDLAKLQQDIQSAMSGGSILSVPVVHMGLGAALVLSGMSLAYAVLCPAG
jgi:hypothetical protein